MDNRRKNNWLRILLQSKNRNIYNFIIVVCIFIIGIGTNMIAIRNTKPRWRPVSQVINKSLLAKIIQDNSVGNYKSLQDSSKTIEIKLEGKKIYLIDFNSPELCGQSGCLYVAYTKEGNRVLNLMLQPTESKLFTINELDSSRICLDIQQPKNQQTFIYTYCYEGTQFIQTITSAKD